MIDQIHGLFLQWPLLFSVPLTLGTILTLGYFGMRFYVWTVAVAVGLWMWGVPEMLALSTLVVMVALNIPVLRRVLISANIMRVLQALKLMPVISETERTALEAGSIWLDGELFSGKPDFKRLMSEPYGELTQKEQSFVDNQVRRVCEMVDDQQAYADGDLSKEVWDYLKRERFLGLIVPEQYGGLGFSALAHSEVVSILASRSVPLTISVMVPNSLGPAELLTHYGTQKQKDYYLPRLARGEEIPCFGLTEPNAGSDAGAMESHGEVIRGKDGQLSIRLNWQKRYITLGAVSTVVALAVKLRDPDNLLGKGENVGITCVLIPASTPGVVLGRRHDPLGVPFFNCPIDGTDVVVSVDQIIGGPDYAGRGWQMLMESLAAGRSISLPASSTGGAKAAARVVSAYAQIRKQFGVSIGSFEGVSEAIGEIGGMAYMMEGARKFTVGAVDSGLKPAVVSAIMKYQSTELSRRLINHAMDVCGGAGISRGPRNLLANSYTAAPIGITVEGANILTRTMIIFGQGAIRCHPYAYKEVTALGAGDVSGFDTAFMGHIGHVVRNGCRALVLSVTRGHFARVPDSPMAPYFRKLAWTSASFAFFADVAMGGYGGALKLRESITGRFSDILSWMYLITATLRRYQAEGYKKEHADFVHYACQYGFAQIQEAFDGLFANMRLPILGTILKYPVSLWSRLNRLAARPSDETIHSITKKLTGSKEIRDEITAGVFIPKGEDQALARLERAYELAISAADVYRKISKAVRRGELPRGKATTRVAEALEKGIISETEKALLDDASAAVQDAVQVDSFRIEEYGAGVMNAHTDQQMSAKTG